MGSTINEAVSPDRFSHGQVGTCGDVLAPIPGERWVCVADAEHTSEEHVSDDGTRW